VFSYSMEYSAPPRLVVARIAAKGENRYIAATIIPENTAWGLFSPGTARAKTPSGNVCRQVTALSRLIAGFPSRYPFQHISQRSGRYLE
jgi:hypothetical protein